MRSAGRDLQLLKPIASPTRRTTTFAGASTSARHGSSSDFGTYTDAV